MGKNEHLKAKTQEKGETQKKIECYVKKAALASQHTCSRMHLF